MRCRAGGAAHDRCKLRETAGRRMLIKPRISVDKESTGPKTGEIQPFLALCVAMR
jgi:hypothetical protein